MTYFVGNSPEQILSGIIKRYMYGLRRNDDGELFLVKVDQLAGGDENTVLINNEGTADDNYPDFEEGIDFLDGLDENNETVFENLRYPQMKWDGRSLLYYIEEDSGLFVQRINENFDYPENVSSPSFSDGPEQDVITTYSTPDIGFNNG